MGLQTQCLQMLEDFEIGKQLVIWEKKQKLHLTFKLTPHMSRTYPIRNRESEGGLLPGRGCGLLLGQSVDTLYGHDHGAICWFLCK